MDYGARGFRAFAAAPLRKRKNKAVEFGPHFMAKLGGGVMGVCLQTHAVSREL